MRKTFGIIIAGTMLLAGCSCAIDAKKADELESRIQTLEAKTGITPSKETLPETSSTKEIKTSVSAAEDAVPETPTKKDIQKALKNAGFYTGEVDGKFGPKTKKSVEEFQTAQGLSADGKVGPNTWDKLKAYFNTAAASPASEIITVETSVEKKDLVQ